MLMMGANSTNMASGKLLSSLSLSLLSFIALFVLSVSGGMLTVLVWLFCLLSHFAELAPSTLSFVFGQGVVVFLSRATCALGDFIALGVISIEVSNDGALCVTGVVSTVLPFVRDEPENDAEECNVRAELLDTGEESGGLDNSIFYEGFSLFALFV